MSNMDIINQSDLTRLNALLLAERAIETLQESQPDVPDPNDEVVRSFERWMLTSPDSDFWPTVERARTAIVTNRLMERVPFIIDLACDDFAHVDITLDSGKGITFCRPFFEVDDLCRREVITHEFFHFVVGAQHHYDATTTEEAINCPHHLSELVFQIALGEINGCGENAICIK